ncbi:MAG: sulfate/molybdate ABC transporter ATP-binding protein, partial [Actinomyces massiliensis]
AQRNVTADLEVGAGRTLALIGPNGSGKSTVCGVVAGLLDADGGRVLLGERELDGPSGFVPAGRRDVALLSQSPGIFAHMSVLDNVAFGPRCRHVAKGTARERAHAELEAAGVEHLAARRGSELSGGQAARVALARALATSPRLLVLDEPMSALDVTARREMRRLVARRAAEEGLTVLLVTHDVLDITALAEDVVVLENGRVAERGSTAEVLAAPVSDFAARLTGTAVLTGRLAGDDESPALKLDEGQVVHGRPRNDSCDSCDGEGAGGSRESLRLGGPGIALVPPDAVALYREPPQGSPRNVLAGRVTGVDRAGALVSVEVRLTGGQTIRAAVTAGAVAEMGIAVDQELWCAIKAVEVRIVPRRERDSAARRSRAGAEESAAERAE